MGNSLKTWYTPDIERKDGTTLVELWIPHIRDAHALVGLQPEGFTPITIVPESAASGLCGISCCCVAIPAGFRAIVSRFGADQVGQEEDATYSPGCHCLAPWSRVNRLVSKQLIVFDTPVKDCKTEDNITVNIDVLIVLEIEKAHDFIYGLGPEKLDFMLRASQEEVMRKMISETTVEKIYDLHGNDTQALVDDMNKKFASYGVRIHHFTIKNVGIPQDMAGDMEDRTLYESMTQEKLQQQESNRLRLNQAEGRQKLKEECDNVYMAGVEQATNTQMKLQMEVNEVLAMTDKEIATVYAQIGAEVQDSIATSDKRVAETNAQALALSSKQQAETEAEVERSEVMARSYSLQKLSAAKCEAAGLLSIGRQGIAEAEGDASESFAAKREQEQEQARLSILSKLADNPHIQISTTLENTMGLAADNSLVNQVAQQGVEAMRMKLAEMTAASIKKLNMSDKVCGGLVRPMPQQQSMSGT